MKKVSFYTLGCKVNQYETNAMAQKFKESGYEIVDMNDDISDICIVNTCTVTNMSDRKSRHSLRRVKEKNPSAIIAAVGCYAQVAKNDLENMPEIDIVLGNEEKANIVQYVEKFIENEKKLIEIEDIATKKEFEDMGQITYTEKTRAFIKVQDGCNQFCSYCIIPYARGRVRSRNAESIIKEITQIAQNGIKEVVITGIHVASYGRDFGNENGLIELLEKINEIEGIKRIRLGSLEPKIITEEFMQRLSKLEKICHHFHLSLQSGCDATLKRMNRRYTSGEYYEKCILIRKYFKHPALTTDVIVGFPGETEKDFEDSLRMTEEADFLKVHAFRYSRREGTAAYEMKNQIDGETKNKRVNRLMEKAEKVTRRFFESSAGEVRTVLFEQEGSLISGYTENYIKVYADGGEEHLNSFQKVKLLEPYKDGMKGEIL